MRKTLHDYYAILKVRKLLNRKRNILLKIYRNQRSHLLKNILKKTVGYAARKIQLLT